MEVRVGGTVHSGFIDASVTLTMDALANDFQLTYSDRWVESGEPLPIEAGDAVQILIDGEVVLDGYADHPEIDVQADKKALTVSGRSKAGDLVDCAVIHPSGTWRNQTVGQIASEVCEPFGILVTVFDDIVRIPRVSLEDGEGAEALIMRLARMRGLVVFSIGGDLVMSRAGAERTKTPLWRGANIIGGKRSSDHSQRFSEYHFHGQTRGSDTVTGQNSTQLHHKVDDTEMRRYRPMLVVAGGAGGSDDLGVRAILERNQRLGRSERIVVDVDSWFDDDLLWTPNKLVEVHDYELRVDADLIVSTVRYQHSPTSEGKGNSVSLEMTYPQAYSAERDVPLRPRGRRRGQIVERIFPAPFTPLIPGDFRPLVPATEDP